MSLETAAYRDLYFSEARQQFDRIAEALRDLERVRNNRASLETAFRAAHTLKGMSATMGYDAITAAAHALEDLLQGVRERPGGAISSDLFFIFRSLDSLRHLLAQLETKELQLSYDTPPVDSSLPIADNGQVTGEPSRVVHIHTEQLDHLNGLINRFMVSAQELAQSGAQNEEATARHLSLAQELRDEAWHLRMAPLGETLNRYPRMLHDLARELGKQVRVLFEGAEVEVGRSILEEINEPLLHLLRNAIVHGIEPITERMKAGKDICGTVRVSACLSGERLNLVVADDGRGLDAQVILETAYAQGFISQAEKNTLTEAEAFKVITRPGFSLSAGITRVAGRGVGMDVVQDKVRALHGSLAIHSQPGLGTSFTIQVPRTLGPIEVELVRAGRQVYAVPSSRIELQLKSSSTELERWRLGNPSCLNRLLRVFELQDLIPEAEREPMPEQCGVIILNHPADVALGVNALLGRGLWSKPAVAQDPDVPLLDLDQLIPPDELLPPHSHE